MDIQEFFNLGDFIPFDITQGHSPQIQNLWDDVEEVRTFYKNNKSSVTLYTVIEEDGTDYVLEGFHLFNRTGFLFSHTHVEIPQETNLIYW